MKENLKEINTRINNGESIASISRGYNVSRQRIHALVNGGWAYAVTFPRTKDYNRHKKHKGSPQKYERLFCGYCNEKN